MSLLNSRVRIRARGRWFVRVHVSHACRPGVGGRRQLVWCSCMQFLCKSKGPSGRLPAFHINALREVWRFHSLPINTSLTRATAMSSTLLPLCRHFEWTAFFPRCFLLFLFNSNKPPLLQRCIVGQFLVTGSERKSENLTDMNHEQTTHLLFSADQAV